MIRRHLLGFIQTTLKVFLLFMFIGITTLQSYASVLVKSGTAVWMPGTTAATEPDLAGIVLHDELINFRIARSDGTLLFQGQLQNRVVRSSSTGALHFYYRIRNTVPGLPGTVTSIVICCFGAGPLLIDYRRDGLGTVDWGVASRTDAFPPQVCLTLSWPGLMPGVESRFVVIKTVATAFGTRGRTGIFLLTGERVSLETTEPVP